MAAISLGVIKETSHSAFFAFHILADFTQILQRTSPCYLIRKVMWVQVALLDSSGENAELEFYMQNAFASGWM